MVSARQFAQQLIPSVDNVSKRELAACLGAFNPNVRDAIFVNYPSFTPGMEGPISCQITLASNSS
jgi:hypothetical protein